MKGHQRKARLKPARNLGGKKPGESLWLGTRPSSENTQCWQDTNLASYPASRPGWGEVSGHFLDKSK